MTPIFRHCLCSSWFGWHKLWTRKRPSTLGISGSLGLVGNCGCYEGRWNRPKTYQAMVQCGSAQIVSWTTHSTFPVFLLNDRLIPQQWLCWLFCDHWAVHEIALRTSDSRRRTKRRIEQVWPQTFLFTYFNLLKRVKESFTVWFKNRLLRLIRID